MANIVVTGGSGFIGTNLMTILIEMGHHVVNIDINKPRNPSHEPWWRSVDILDEEQLKETISSAKPEIIFHFAARTDLDGKSVDDYPVNTLGVRNLINAIHYAEGLHYVVFASSMLVCPIGYRPTSETDYSPTTPYGESKVLGERLVRENMPHHIPWTILRPTSIWGPWFDRPYKDFFMAIKRGMYIHPKGHRIRRSYGFVLNTVKQITSVAFTSDLALNGRTVYLADYEPIELLSWANTIQSAFECRKVREISLLALKAAAHIGDALKRMGMKSPPVTSFRLNNLLTEAVQDTSPLKQVCPVLSYDVDQGVKLTVDWINKYHNKDQP